MAPRGVESAGIIRAAGGVLWRTAAYGAVEVALVHRPKYGDWSLPKGKLWRGEHPLMTACREVAEETGIHAAAGRRLDVSHYDSGAGRKVVEYWAMHGPQAPFTPTAEVDVLAWLPPADARGRLEYEQDTYAVDAFEAVAASTADSSVLLVRNGRAVPVRRWAGTEESRPLDDTGHKQAEALRRVLPAFGPTRLLAACGTRFIDTMRPLGGDLGLAAEPESALAEGEYAAHPHRGLTRILELTGAGRTTVVCAPGAVIRHLVATLADDADLALGGLPSKKGSVWALFFRAGQLTAADYYADLASPRSWPRTVTR